MLQNAARVFIGIGYNSSAMSFEQLSSLKLVVMNNVASHCQGEEGGRFDADDSELWETCSHRGSSR